VTLDHREVAPLKAHRDMYLDDDGNEIKNLSRSTLLAAGVPGSVDGLLRLLTAYGSLPLSKVMAPAIKLASKGFIVDHYLADHITKYGKQLMKNPAAAKKFSVNGQPIKAGDRWFQKDLGKTLKRIAKHGRDGFYAGETADLIVAEMERGGGIISHADLEGYESKWRAPIHGTYRGHDIWTMGPPSSAVLIVQMLNMLEPFDVGEMGWGSAEVAHLMIEAERRAYADRAEHLGDSDFYDVPLDMLSSKQYAASRFADFDETKATDSEDISSGSAPAAESTQTTHFSVMDASGMAVAFTTTLNGSYGNKIVVPGTGVLLNNEMNDFSVKPNTLNDYELIGREANAIEPGKRMLSSMSPTIVTHAGKPVLVTGSPGGSTIITTTLQVIVNVIDHGMNLDDAVTAPRFHHQWKPNGIAHERYTFSPDTLSILEDMGHVGFRALTYFRGIGDANSVLVKEGVLQGVKDPRTDGQAVGF
jgi:gamma-glutamyltranspeptidase/glutathione hydrolase